MATATHAARSRSSPAPKPGAAVSKARKAAARPKASWAFDGGGAVGGGDVAVQAKMEVSQPGDVLEREADRVAAHVVGRSPAVAAPARGAGREDEPMAHVQRMAAPSAAKEDETAAAARVHRACADCAAEDEDTGKKAVHRRAQEEKEEKGETGVHVQRLPQSAEKVRAADLTDDREERPPRLARMAMGDEEQTKVHRRVDDDSERMARGRIDDDSASQEPGRVDADAGAKVHRDAAPEPFGGAAEGEDAGAHDDAASGFAPTAFEDRLRLERMKGGAPLPRPLRDVLEPGMHTNLGRVRVHVDDGAAALARSVRARAFTVGRHIFFGSGQFQPQTQQGQKLVAHEVTHVLQQRGGLHSVQREILDGPAGPSSAEKQAEKGDDAAAKAAPDTVEFADLMRIFNLREGVTPVQVLEIIRELLEKALRVLPKAEKLLPFVVPALAKDRTVRRYLRSQAHELRLEATHATEGPAARQPDAVATKWELRFLDGTRAPATGGQTPGGTDEDAIGVDTDRPRTAAEPGGDLKAKVANAPAPAAPAPVAVKPAPAPAPAEGAAGPGPAEAAAATPAAPAAGAAKAAPAAAEETIPSSPEEDPNFQAVAAGADKAETQSATHGEAGPAAVNAESAAPVDAAEKAQLQQDKQVDTMNVQETGEFNVDQFVRDVEAQVAAKTPDTLEKARNFKRDGVVDMIGAQVRGKAGTEADKTGAPLKTAANVDPSSIPVTPRTAAELAPAPIGAPPKDIDAGRAVPPERPPSQVEDVIEGNKQATEAQMAELGVPDPETTLRTSNEPDMVGAVEAKDAFDADATASKEEFRRDEAGERGEAKKDNAMAGMDAIGAMVATRGDLIGKVQKGQHGGKAKSESQHDRVKREVGEIYASTKTSVQTRLADMQKEVFEKFDTQSKAAMSTFENAVVDAERRWNEKSVLDRAVDQIASFVTRLPTELEAELRVIRLVFILEMTRIVREMAQIVSRELKAAKEEVKTGREKIKSKIAELGDDLTELKAELTKEFDGKFDALEGDIKAARDAVVAGVAQRYKASLAATDKLLADVRERNKSFLDKFADKIGGVIAQFVELKAKLESVFERAKGAILMILADPKAFMRNLFAGIGLGFQNFGKNILKHLVQGAVAWLTGAVQSAGIELPEKFDAAGILSIFLQLTGLTIDNVLARARVIWGDKVVDAILLGVAGAEKAIELFQVFKTEGVMGLVRILKEKIIALKDAALDKVKSAIQIQIVEAAIKFLLGLLTPVGALVTAVIKIVDTVMFFIRNADRLAALVNSIIDGVNDVLAGNIGGLAVKVENALAAAVPIVLDFLASLLGIGAKIVETIKNVIAFIRKPVEQAIDFLLTGIKNLLGPVIARIMGAFGMGPQKPAAAAPAAAPGAEAGAQPGAGAPAAAQPAGPPAAPGSPEAIRDAALAKMAEPDPKEDETAEGAIKLKKSQAATLIHDAQQFLPKGKTLKITVDDNAEKADEAEAVSFEVGLSPGPGGKSKFKGVPSEERTKDAIGGDIIGFMVKMSQGATIKLPGRGTYTRATLEKSWAIETEREDVLKGGFRKVKPKTHEWIPVNLIREVIDRAGDPKHFLEGETWIHVQDDLRSPNSSVIFDTGKAVRMAKDEKAGRDRIILQGHSGAGLFFPSKSGKLSPQTEGINFFHNELRDAFNNAGTVGGVLDGLSAVAKDWIWNGTPVDLHPDEVDASGKQIPSTLPETQRVRFGEIFGQFKRTRAKFG